VNEGLDDEHLTALSETGGKMTTPSRIAGYVNEVPQRLTGANGNGAQLPLPDLKIVT
jgi:hypothetical protein